MCYSGILFARENEIQIKGFFAVNCHACKNFFDWDNLDRFHGNDPSLIKENIHFSTLTSSHDVTKISVDS